MNRYKIYCETDGWVEVIASTTPTVCPIDGTHTVNADSVTVVERDVQITDGDYVADSVSLYDYKQLKFNEIDKRTEELIAQGFAYNSKTFSLSNNAQINLLGVDIKRNDGILPLTFHTVDDMDEETFTTPEDLDNFFMIALASKKAHLDSGSALKVSIRNAVDRAAVDAVIDNR
jgi:hypothetical protein